MKITIIVAFVVLIALLATIIFKRLALRHQWKEVRQKAKEKGLELLLVSDKQYRKRHHPLPHGGTLYASGGYVHVRYECVNQERALSFIATLQHN